MKKGQLWNIDDFVTRTPLQPAEREETKVAILEAQDRQDARVEALAASDQMRVAEMRLRDAAAAA